MNNKIIPITISIIMLMFISFTLGKIYERRNIDIILQDVAGRKDIIDSLILEIKDISEERDKISSLKDEVFLERNKLLVLIDFICEKVNYDICDKEWVIKANYLLENRNYYFKLHDIYSEYDKLLKVVK